MQRPVILTIVGWLIIIYNLLKLILPVQYLLHPPQLDPKVLTVLTHAMLLELGFCILMLVIVIGLLRGKDNARWAYIILQVLYWGYMLMVNKMHPMVITSTVIALLIVIILFLPQVNAYFNSKKGKVNESKQ